MSLTKVTYSMISGATVNVLDFGADPTGAADSTAAIQNAINSIQDGVVFFPVGNYKTTAKIYTSYGQNIKLEGSLVYGGVTITAYHADHIFEYKFTVAINGIVFTRDAAYVATAKTNFKNGIHSDNSGGAIDGAAYTRIENCIATNSYAGIRAHGTFQYIENCATNDNSIGLWLIGAEHTALHCAQEQNTITGLLVEGNGHNIYGNYADDNCSSGTAQRGAVTFAGDMNTFVGGHFNDNNAANHICFVSARHNYIGNCNFYSTTARVQLYSAGGNDSFRNVIAFTDKPAITSIGNSYGNTFPEGSTYTATAGGFDNLTPTIPVYCLSLAFGNTEIGAGDTRLINGTATASHARSANRFFGESTFQAATKLQVIGGTLYVYGDGAAQTLDVKVQCQAEVSGVGTVTTDLITYAGANTNGIEANSTATRMAPIDCGDVGSSFFSFSIKNNGASALKGGSVVIYYRLISNGLYA